MQQADGEDVLGRATRAMGATAVERSGLLLMSGFLVKLLAAGGRRQPVGSPIVLQTLDQVGRGIAEVVDSVNKAQAHFQKVSRGGGTTC